MQEPFYNIDRNDRKFLQAADLKRLNAMIDRLSSHGVRITERRKQTLISFLETSGFVSAMDVYNTLIKIYPGISYDTVYRNIRLFREVGVIEQFVFDESVRFKLNCTDGIHEHYHLICVRCEKTIPVDYEPEKLAAGMSDQFKPLKYKFDVFGYCSECNPEYAYGTTTSSNEE
ncbi:Fur family transcriptional regulator [Paenibacillus sp. NPDC056579]|uniref:Fur family transcriptional regulator n=1 Tax=Paenibacillus sp. NPDC056579 TaxID=3345871 RepID=UPI00368F570B